ncbi:MAG: hemerythrin domain-containing protein [Deltaproteobacteria bacterium]|nr:MAG: hemerythrin domain-containing protein [Deltaproteobacteria bacterium]
MRRDPRLRALSSDHHRALVLARRAAQAADAGGAAAAEAWRALADTFARELEPHFAVEEQVLLPALREAGHGGLVDRTLEDHVALRAYTSADMEPAAGLRGFADRLTSHVRFEERELFEVAQRALPDGALDAVAAAAERAQPAR